MTECFYKTAIFTWNDLSIVICRYSDNTIEVLEMLDEDDNIDLDLILALITHIVTKEEVSFTPEDYLCFNQWGSKFHLVSVGLRLRTLLSSGLIYHLMLKPKLVY